VQGKSLFPSARAADLFIAIGQFWWSREAVRFQDDVFQKGFDGIRDGTSRSRSTSSPEGAGHPARVLGGPHWEDCLAGASVYPD
jgi:hypothetical protein